MYRFDTSVHQFAGNDPVGQVLDTYNSVINGIVNRAAAVQSIKQKEAMLPGLLKKLEVDNAGNELQNDMNLKTQDLQLDTIKLKHEEMGVDLGLKKVGLDWRKKFMGEAATYMTGANEMNQYLPQEAKLDAPPVANKEVIREAQPVSPNTPPQNTQAQEVWDGSQRIPRRRSDGVNLTTYSPNEKGGDSNSRKGKGAFENTLIPGESISLSPDLMRKAGKGAATYDKSGNLLGYADDQTDDSLTNTVDLLDMNGSKGNDLRYLAGGVTFGPGRKPTRYSKEAARGFGFNI